MFMPLLKKEEEKEMEKEDYESFSFSSLDGCTILFFSHKKKKKRTYVFFPK